MGIAVLAGQTAGTALRNPESILQNTDGSAASLRAQKFPSANSYGSAGLRLEHRFVQLCIRKKALETGVFLLQFLEAFGLGGLWAPPDCVYIPPYSCCQR